MQQHEGNHKYKEELLHQSLLLIIDDLLVVVGVCVISNPYPQQEQDEDK